ncbi:MAG: hypothetical protein J0J01_14380 [Reyranella sp.]|uniref:hypothetical protein n=1 Tax=Reyranella sp. TaxID=1929291 RepID=UPI001ACC6A5A|nr:hypothetical protein [Reyranella sp.]MBN9088093.1 hypothetical protein [Reyranella sp.]
MPAHRATILMLALAACSATPPGERWERPADHSLPAASESLYCRDEARRQASARYPDQPAREERGLPRISDERRFPAEIRFYELCMTRAGFVRVSGPAG